MDHNHSGKPQSPWEQDNAGEGMHEYEINIDKDQALYCERADMRQFHVKEESGLGEIAQGIRHLSCKQLTWVLSPGPQLVP